MKANEFRLGNIVNDNEVVTAIQDGNITTFDGKSYDYDSPPGIEPAPLTEDWLVRFGCEIKEGLRNDGSQYMYVNLEAIQPYRDYGSGFEWDYNQLYLCDCDSGKIGEQIKYVHQLQNIYFALTNKELTIK